MYFKLHDYVLYIGLDVMIIYCYNFFKLNFEILSCIFCTMAECNVLANMRFTSKSSYFKMNVLCFYMLFWECKSNRGWTNFQATLMQMKYCPKIFYVFVNKMSWFTKFECATPVLILNCITFKNIFRSAVLKEIVI